MNISECMFIVRGDKMKYQYPNGKIVTRKELWESFRKSNPIFAHDKIEFEMSLYVDIQNGTLREIMDKEANE